MKRPQSAKPGYKGYWGQISTDQIGEHAANGKNPHRQNIKIMKPDLTTHDFARILPKKIHQDKERLYSEALQLKQTVNELMEENVRLKTKISILQKEKDKMNRYIDSNPEGLNRQGNSRLNIYGNKNTDKENMIVRNLKKIVRQSKEECEYLKTQNQKIKKTIKYTKINELQIEKKIILDENKRLGVLLEEYNNQIINQDELEKENEQLKSYLEEEIEQNKGLVEENQKYQEIIEGLEEKIKAENQKFHAKEKKMQRDLALEKRKTNEQHKYIEDLRKELKTLQENLQKANTQKKTLKHARPSTSHPANYRSNQAHTQPKENALNVQANLPAHDLETNEIKKRNEQLELELREVRIRLQQSENELSRRKPVESPVKENATNSQPVMQQPAEEKKVVEKKAEAAPEKAEIQATKLQKKYDFQDSPGKGEESYSHAFEPESEEENYEQEFQKVNESSHVHEAPNAKKGVEIEKIKKQFGENEEEVELYKKDDKGHPKDSKGQGKKKKKGGYKPDKKLLSEIKELLTYRMKSQRYPFEDLKADIESAEAPSFSYSDLCNMLINEPFYLTSNYTKAFLCYCFEKENVKQSEELSKDVLIAKIRKVVDDFELLDENEEKQMILRVTEMTSTYPYEFETAFENIKNGEDTVRKQDLITMFQKLQLQDKYIELIIAELSMCSDDLEHLNFHGFFERFYMEEDEYRDPNAIEEQGEESEESYKNTSRIKKKGRNTRKASEEQEERAGQFMLAPEQPIESKNYAYDEDIVSDDGRI